MDFTVAIPTYNGAARLPLLLDRLQQQVVAGLTWEIWVVNNNSTDQTTAIVQEYQAQWIGSGALHLVHEPRRGTAYARQRAVEVARSPWIGFLDDDTLPAHEWVAIAYRFAAQHPTCGAFGGRVIPQFELPPPPGFERIAPYLAIVERGDLLQRYERRDRVLPPGAGLVVQRQIWLQVVPAELVLNYTGRQSIVASEDLEALIHIQQAGFDIWYVPELQLQHYIPAWRLQADYLLGLMHRIGQSRHRLRMLRCPLGLRPLMTLIYFLNDLRRLSWHGWRHGFILGQAPPDDIVLACEYAMLQASLLSPGFLWWRWWQRRRNAIKS